MTRAQQPTLVLGGTGKIGRRVVERLTASGLPVRVGSRSGEPRFDWEDRSTCAAVIAKGCWQGSSAAVPRGQGRPCRRLDTWRTRASYPALEAAGLRRRGPYRLRHSFATEALAAGISIFELAHVMGASVKTIDKHYGHLARDSEQAIRDRLDARAARSGVVVASDPDA